MDEMTTEETRENRVRTLSVLVSRLVQRIVDPATVATMPRELRCLLAILSTSAQQYMPDMLLQILNGFIVLRVFSPTIVAPESVGIVPMEMAPGPRGRRNVILVAKVLQSIGNFGASVGKKEQYMDALRPCIEQLVPVLGAFFESLAQPYPGMDRAYLAVADAPDDLPYRAIDVREVSLSDLFELHRVLHCSAAKLVPLLIAAADTTARAPVGRGARATIALGAGHSAVSSVLGSPPPSPSSLSTSSSSGTSGRSQSFSSAYPPALQPISLQATGGGGGGAAAAAAAAGPMSELVSPTTAGAAAPGTFQPAKPQIMANSASTNTRNAFVRGATRRVAWQASLLSIMPLLGPPPVFSHQNTLVDIDITSSSPATGAPTTTAAAPAAPAAATTTTTTNTSAAAMEQAKFLYSGPKSVKCGSIFYFVVTRFDPALLHSMPALIAFVTKTMDSAVHTGSYTLVVDLSWSTLSAEGMQTVCENVKAFWAMFPRTYKKNLRQVVVLQPTKFYHVVYGLLKQFISKKAYRKFVEVYDWKQLAGVLGVNEESVVIPESSKHNVSKVYRVVKVNAYGKKQERLIKFTIDSLLNLDTHATRIHNEKLLSQIDEISVASPGSLEIFMRFQADPQKKKKKKTVFGAVRMIGSGSSQHEDIRTYICSTLAERDAILQDLYASAFRCGYSSGRQEFKVVKVNRVGKHQERVFKLTVDSLMNVANNEIRHEMCFAGIDEVKADQTDKNVVWLKYKSETLWRQIIMDDADTFIRLLQDGLRRYRADQGN